MDDEIMDDLDLETPDDEILGEHPDPVLLSEPGFDESGRLVWGSTPLPR